MSSLLDKLNDVLEKGGAPADKVREFILANQDLAKIEIPTELNKSFDSLMGFEAAVSNPAVKSRLKADFLKTADETLLDRSQKYLPADAYEAIKGETSTYKRLELFADKMEELKKASKTASADGDKDEVKRLNAELAAIKDAIKQEKENAAKSISEVETKYHQREVNRELDAYLRSQKLPRHILDDPDGLLLVKAKIERAMNQHEGLTFDLDASGRLALGKKGSNGLEEFYDPATNKKVDLATFTDRVLGEHKLLSVSDAPVGGNSTIVIDAPTSGTATAKRFSVDLTTE
jgi:hypothetical protein